MNVSDMINEIKHMVNDLGVAWTQPQYIEAINHGIKVVSAPACTGRKSGIIPGRCVCR